MATILSVDSKLIERALEISGEKSAEVAITKALQEFIARREQTTLVNLFDRLEWDADFDYRSERSRD